MILGNMDKVYLYPEAIDFRKQMNGLSALVSSYYNEAIDKQLFIFFNKGKNKLKCLYWHNNGMALLYKRLEQGRFKIPADLSELELNQFYWLLLGYDVSKMAHLSSPKYSIYY